MNRSTFFSGGRELAGSPVEARNSYQVTIWTWPGTQQREDLNRSFWFVLPDAWLTGTVELRTELNFDHLLAESDYNDNALSRTVTFRPGNQPVLLLVPTSVMLYYWDSPSASRSVLDGLHRYHPITNSWQYVWQYEGTATGTGTDWTLMFSLGVIYAFRSDDYPGQKYVGTVDPGYPGNPPGMAWLGGPTAFVKMNTGDGGWGSWYRMGGATMAHELGHTYGFRHIYCYGTEYDGGDVDATYPWPLPNCALADESTDGYYGIDTEFRRLGLRSPMTFGNKPFPRRDEYYAGPIMSYELPRWMSPWEYCKFLAHYGSTVPCYWTATQAQAAELGQEPPVSPAEAAELHEIAVARDPAAFADPLEVAALRAAAGYVFVGGHVEVNTGAGAIDLVVQLDQAPQHMIDKEIQQLGRRAGLAGTPGADALTAEVAQLDAAGQVLATNPLNLAAIDQAKDMRLFTELVPRAAGVAKLVLRVNSAQAGERTASAHPPQVTIEWPNGGETVGPGSVLRWTSQDADGDPLTFMLEYSLDDGQTWRIFADSDKGNSYQLQRPLPGSQKARLRVTALDGFHTTVDVSDGSFTIPLNLPQVDISQPGNGSLQRPGEPVAFFGTAYDIDDGPLPEEAYEWRSDRDGALGTGTQVEAVLSRGRHVITLAARDRHGDTGSATVVVNVGERLYLPLLRR